VTKASPREQRSLFGEILDWMLVPLLLLWPMSAALTWLVAQNIAARPYDRDLAQLTRMISRQLLVAAEADPARSGALRLPEPAAALLRSDDVDRVYFQVLGERGELLAGDRELPAPDLDPAVAAPPLGEVQFRDELVQNEPVRVASLRLAPVPGEPLRISVVQVGETMEKRSRLTTEIIKGVLLPQYVILPVAVLLVWFALARGIAPLSQLQQRIQRRQSHDLSPIDQHDVPEEVAPLVNAINDLLNRLDQSMSTQKHFLADAAHQLKTPLAGLRTQAELAQREIDNGGGDPQSVKRSLQQIARSSQRAAHMVNQLLAMARAEDEEQARRAQDYSLVRLATDTVQDFVPRALDKRIDLGYEGPELAGDSVPRDDPQPGGQRVAVHARGRHGDGACHARPLRPGAGAAGRGQRPGHPGGRARAGVPALLPGAGHQRRRQWPGARHRARDRRPPPGQRHHRPGPRTDGAGGRRRPGHAVHGALPAAGAAAGPRHGAAPGRGLNPALHQPAVNSA
jgi:two-component system sensor histidine kinase TctE